MGARDGHQPPRLPTSLAEAQPEMGRDQAKCAPGGSDLRLDGTARLALRMRDVMHLRGNEGPATHNHLAILAVRGDDRFRFDTMMADGLAQNSKSRACRRDGSARIDLLQRYHVRIVVRDRFDDPRQVETPIRTDAAVNVPCHYAHTSARAAQAVGLLQRRTRACAPIDAASQATTASTKSKTFARVGSVTMVQIW
jgi:hypothetical protein